MALLVVLLHVLHVVDGLALGPVAPATAAAPVALGHSRRAVEGHSQGKGAKDKELHGFFISWEPRVLPEKWLGWENELGPFIVETKGEGGGGEGDFPFYSGKLRSRLFFYGRSLAKAVLAKL